ncbi:MAG: hypothetical protein HY080_14680 [Gammaproteobacteria bacterium]|nr:hypothetical protein [Gammaproteobacteria bacterium]
MPSPKSLLIPLLLSLTAAVFGAGANLFYKRAASKMFEVHVWQNGYLFLGLTSFILVLSLFVAAYRSGGTLILVYGAYSTTYLWSLFFSHKFENEPISTLHILGSACIIIGVSLIGLGFKRS